MSKKVVLIADDSVLARMFAKRCLDIGGIGEAEYLEVENGVKALDILNQKHVDLLVSDITMPEMGGVDLVRKIKADEKFKGLKIIMITSAGNIQEREFLAEIGVEFILTKPLTSPMMSEAIIKLFGEI